MASLKNYFSLAISDGLSFTSIFGYDKHPTLQHTMVSSGVVFFADLVELSVLPFFTEDLSSAYLLVDKIDELNFSPDCPSRNLQALTSAFKLTLYYNHYPFSEQKNTDNE